MAAPETDQESFPQDLEVTSSSTWYGTLDNQLGDWWDGGGIPITWSVSNTKNEFWDGSSRPDHAPPQGFQGLEQPAFSPPYTARLEVNDPPTFTLQPTIAVDGKNIALTPTVVSMKCELLCWWVMNWASDYCAKTESGGRAREAVEQYSAWTPRGLLQYEYTSPCGQEKFVLSVHNLTGR